MYFDFKNIRGLRLSSIIVIFRFNKIIAKQIFFILLLFCSSLNLSAQQKGKDFSKIMQSTSIYEIDAYLRIAHPDDPKRSILKPRLIKMLKEYIRTAHPADSRVVDFQEKIALLRRKSSTRISYVEMSENIRQKQIAKYQADLEAVRKGENAGSSQALQEEIFVKSSTLGAAEQEEFKMLMTQSAAEHKNKTVNILNSLFDNDPNSKESIVLIENKSDCNMIVRIEGVGRSMYRLPVASKTENSIVVAKGNYLFSSNVCGAQYASQKSVHKAIMVSLNNPGK
ncbi:hypothetical protein SAMN05421765_0794 [Kaistella antarctica]|uniref:DUF6759 domain-containing protein n=3 Tax=Bacteroidota TaxID=976 RepID=A0A448NUB5_9FLAO|nr:hypothetical protein SAMN05421765_0794 [Kaistella antarctica]VEI01189.1 Uncharacterised protein [Kaistella antarctica]